MRSSSPTGSVSPVTEAAESYRPSANAQVQEFLLGEAVANAGYAVLVADDEMRYLAASDAACELLGYSRDELLQMHVPDVVEESDAADRYREMTQSGRQRGRITLVRKDGSRVDAHYEAYETRIAHMPYYVSLLTALTEI
jgi:PAS domain S-box-containing protein